MVEYWVWLQQVLGYGSNAIHGVIREYKTAYNFYKADYNEKIKKVKLSPSQIKRLNKVSKKTVYGIVNECNKTGIEIITPENEKYPNKLLHIPNPPAVIYSKGKIPLFDEEVCITVVGPRKPSAYGVEKTFEIAKSLTKGGCVIISGGAVGIDTAAHLGALAENGVTVAVLGCGINHNYLMVNSKLRTDICKNGCLISEYPPLYQVSKATFPQRNRLLSALAQGVLVAEAPEKSGSLITANYAAEHGKDVFVIPGSPDNKYYAGSNKLLRDGAKAFIEPIDILEEYVEAFPHKINLHQAYDIIDNRSFNDFFNKYSVLADTPNIDLKKIDESEQARYIKRTDVSALPENAQKVYNIANEEFSTDEMVCKLDKDILDIQSAIMELQLLGIVESLPGGRYKILK